MKNLDSKIPFVERSVPISRAFLTSVLLCYTLAGTAQFVNIPDSVVETDIRRALDKPTGDITVEDMESLTVLEVFHRDDVPVRSLEGLQFAINLTNLTISGTDDDVGIVVDDFAPLAGLINLTTLELAYDGLTNVSFLSGLDNLTSLSLAGNHRLRDYSVLTNLINLTELCLDESHLTSLSVLSGLTNLTYLHLGDNSLGEQADFSLLADLINLTELYVNGNFLTNVSLPAGLSSLTTLDLRYNQLATLVLPEPVAPFVIPTVEDLVSQGVAVYTYRVVYQISLARLPTLDVEQSAGSVRIFWPFPGTDFVLEELSILNGPPVTGWTVVPVASYESNATHIFITVSQPTGTRFYRLRLDVVPMPNMVWIPPGTFTMGSLDTEVDRISDEGPQTAVTISQGFWMGKYEVTQSDYTNVTGLANPSFFTGDLSRPVESVSWDDARSYCAMLTTRERNAGRIPVSYEYRLPTEAEWEYACRAGTTTRFSHGDDPGYTELTGYAWYNGNSGSMTHPVGEKGANPWGLYDMHGNVSEWCLDDFWWYPGGAVTDPIGPPMGSGAMLRGGDWLADGGGCRSAWRGDDDEGDDDVGFRVALAPIHVGLAPIHVGLAPIQP